MATPKTVLRKGKGNRHAPSQYRIPRLDAVVEGILRGLSFNKAVADAGYKSTGGEVYKRLRTEPRVLAAIEDALKANAMTRERLVGGLLEIAEDQRQKAADRNTAWKTLADVHRFLAEGQAKAADKADAKITVVFEGVSPTTIKS